MRFLTFPATKRASRQTAAPGALRHGEEIAMKNSHLPASLVSLNSRIENRGMNNTHRLLQALAVLWAHLPPRLPRRLQADANPPQAWTLQMPGDPLRCGGTKTVSAPCFAEGASGDKKRWNWRLWICYEQHRPQLPECLESCSIHTTTNSEPELTEVFSAQPQTLWTLLKNIRWLKS